MAASVFEKLKEIYPTVIGMMSNDRFNSHEFMLVLVREHQELYVQALLEQNQSEQPSQVVAEKIASGLKERTDLVTHIGSEPIENVFEQTYHFDIWQKV